MRPCSGAIVGNRIAQVLQVESVLKVIAMSDSKVIITIKNNGPLRVEGAEFEIRDAAGNAFNLGGRTAVSICRCGASKKQPFCDGSHGECKFASEVTAYDLPPK